MNRESGEANELAGLRVLGLDVPDEDPAAKARARARLSRAIDEDPISRRRRPPILRWGAIASLLTISLWVLVLFPGVADRSTEASPLIRLAAVASEQPEPSIPPGSFAYLSARVRATTTTTNITTGESEVSLEAHQRETWISPDGSGLIIERPVEPDFGGVERFRAEAGTLRFVELNGLPTDPQGLLIAIEGPGLLDGPRDDLELLNGIGALLRDSYASAEHRSALIEIVEGIEGVQISEGYRDPIGREAIAVSLDDGLRQVTLGFDPETSRLLFERDERTDGTFFEATYLNVGIATESGESPDVAH